jgi:hypothetical protein
MSNNNQSEFERSAAEYGYDELDHLLMETMESEGGVTQPLPDRTEGSSGRAILGTRVIVADRHLE